MPATIKELIAVNQSTLEYFRQSFKQSEEAKEYVYSRVSRNTATIFKIGYAPSTGLIGWLAATDANLVKIAKEIGLIGVSNRGIYQKFHNRIMIPIFHAGVIIGFGARALDPSEKAKYINSSSSPLYHKRDTLYGLHHNRLRIQHDGVAYLVEGYFDVLGMAEYGFRSAVASCGTSFTAGQAALLKRYAKKVYVLFDGDAAGQAAAAKAKPVLQREKLYAGRIILPNGFDPDTFLKKYSKTELRKLKVKY
jgi:DNA primase